MTQLIFSISVFTPFMTLVVVSKTLVTYESWHLGSHILGVFDRQGLLYFFLGLIRTATLTEPNPEGENTWSLKNFQPYREELNNYESIWGSTFRDQINSSSGEPEKITLYLDPRTLNISYSSEIKPQICVVLDVVLAYAPSYEGANRKPPVFRGEISIISGSSEDTEKRSAKLLFEESGLEIFVDLVWGMTIENHTSTPI